MREVAPRVDSPGQPEVGDVGFPLAVDQDIGRLQIAVEDAAPVGVIDGRGDGRDQPRRGREIGRELAEPPIQALPLDQLHAEESPARGMAHFVDRHDVGMVEVGDRLGLVLEPDQLGLAGELGGPDDLEGDQPVQCGLPRLVDDAHPAPAQLLQDLVTGHVRPLGPARRGFAVRSAPQTVVRLRCIDRRAVPAGAVHGRVGAHRPVRVPAPEGRSAPRPPNTASITSSCPGTAPGTRPVGASRRARAAGPARARGGRERAGRGRGR